MFSEAGAAIGRAIAADLPSDELWLRVLDRIDAVTQAPGKAVTTLVDDLSVATDTLGLVLEALRAVVAGDDAADLDAPDGTHEARPAAWPAAG